MFAGANPQRAAQPLALTAAPDELLVRRFERQAALQPHSVALTGAPQSLTYQQLNEQANIVAHALLNAGIARGEFVAVMLPPSVELLAAVIGVQKAGAAYVPLDPAYPQERLQVIVAQATPQYLLTSEALALQLPTADAECLLVDTLLARAAADRLSTAEFGNPDIELQADDLCYLMFTSGSTGVPNGVLVTHGNIAGLFANVQGPCEFSATDHWSAMHSFAFGFSVWEMWGPLTTGGRLLVVPAEQRGDPFAWASLVIAEQVSVLSITPSAFRQWLASDSLPAAAALANLRLIVFSGEAVRADDLQRWFARYGQTGPRLLNTYALTETAGRVALLAYAPGDAGEHGNIGWPTADAQLFVVDRVTGQIVPPGDVGELLIAGPMVTRGYLHDPVLTAQRFIDFDSGGGNLLRCYRSGDLARRNSDGSFSFTGRADAQIKLRGHRIELQDIENVLRNHPGVSDAAVVLDENGPAPQLVAWLVPPAAKQDNAVELWPSLGEYQVYDPLLYDFMSADEVRVASYRRAFERCVRDKIVLDIGTGKDALLARLCAAAGARKVYAVEVLEDACAAARALIAELGLDDRVVVIQGDIQDIVLPEPVEVCTQGIVGNIGSSDGIASIWNDARRLFAPEVIAIPSRCETLIAPAQLPAALREAPAFTPLAATYVERIFAAAGGPFDVRLCVRNFPLTGLLATPAVFEDLDFTAAVPIEYTDQAEFVVTQAGWFDGFVLWTRIHTDVGESVDFLQHQQAWLPVWFPVADDAIPVRQGDRIRAQWRCSVPVGQIFPDYLISTVVIAAESACAPQKFTYRSPHAGAALGQTGMHRRLLAAIDKNTQAADSEPGRDIADVATWVRAQLPAHMLPARWELTDTLPLNSNGKLDRRALQARCVGADNAMPVAVPPDDPLEAAIAALWCRVLGRTTIGRDEEFFTLGGDSILAVRLTTEVQRYLDDAVFLAALFDAPTVSSYTAWLREHHAAAVARRMTGGERLPLNGSILEATTPAIALTRDSAPLSWPQQSLWILQQLYPDSTAANEQFLIRVTGGAKPEQIRSAWHAVLAAHDILRTCFGGSAAEPRQLVIALEQCIANDATPVCDLRDASVAAAQARLRTDAAAAITVPFDLSHAPLLRTRLYRLPADELVLLVTAHHIVADGLCVGLIRDALALACASAALDRPALQYADFSIQQRQQVAAPDMQTGLDWWRTQLAGHTGQLLNGNPAGDALTGREQRVEFAIAADLADRLRALARAEGATLFMLLLAAWRSWLQRCFAESDLLIGAPVTLRRDSATASMLGCMVNNVVFRNPGSTQRSFRELLQAERETALAAYEHSTVPFEKIVEAVQPARTLGRHPLFQVLFMFEDRSAPPARAGGLRFDSDVLPVDRASYWDLELSVTECGIGKSLPAFIGIRADLFDADALATWPEGFVAMLEALALDPDTTIAQLPLLSAARQRQMLDEWNSTHMPVSANQTLHGLFAAQAVRTPANIAVQDARETLTYAELRARATRYAAVLAGHGVNHGSRVALSVTRSGDSVALLLAVLQRGACWLPLDPAYPAARLALMIEDSQPDLIICDAGNSFITNHAVLRLPDLHAMATADAGSAAAPVTVTSADAAYILFTSGSTGRPKGALSAHAGAVSRCQWMWHELQFTSAEVFAQRTSLNFVDSIWEIFGPLLHGARLVVLPAAQEQEPNAIVRWLQQEQITHLVTVPVLLDALLTASTTNGVPAALRSVISSGEALQPSLVRRCAEVWPQAELINTYGTSETWDASYFRVPAAQRMRVVPIGKPVANAGIYILDAGGQPVPPGVIGELHVGGLALAREYVGNPELTRARFVPKSFAGVPAVRLYRTGDLASYRADGNIILAGRADRQIKLRGLRIEPADVESPALAYPGVRQCALRLQQPADGEPWLALYVAADKASFATQGLREFLQASLPRAMVPADICVLEQLPLTPSGKLDANALPDLATPVAVAGLYVAPRDSVEESLAAIWREALGVAQVGVHDDFFALRGHSLLAVQVIARVSDQFALELPLQTLFETPTIAGLARSIAALRWTRSGEVPSEGFAADDREVLRL